MDPTYAHITGIISSSTLRKGGGRNLSIFFPNSQQTYSAVCYLKLPIRKSDGIDGKVRLDNDQIMHIEELPFLEPSQEKTEIIKCLMYGLEIGFGQASKVYGQLYRNHPSAEAVITYLNERAQNRFTDQEPIPLLTADETRRLLTWWYRERCVRTLELLGLSKSEINSPYQSCTEILHLCYHNPYAVVTLPLIKCDLLMRLFKKEIIPSHRVCGEIIRFLLKRAQDGSACIPKSLLSRHYPAVTSQESLLTEEYGVVADLDCYYLRSVHEIETKLSAWCIKFIQGSPPETQTYVVPASLSDDQHQAVVGALHQRLSIITGTAGTGKCLGKDTLLLRHDGSTAPVQTINVGDLLVGPDGHPRVVLSLAEGEDILYRIVPDQGDPFVCNGDHLLTLEFAGELRDISVRDYLQHPQGRLYYQGVRLFASPKYYAWLEILAQPLTVEITDDHQRQELIFSARAWGCQVHTQGCMITLIPHPQGRYFQSFTVQEIGWGTYYGFQITGDGRFLLHDFLVTHNTTCLAEVVRQLEIFGVEHLICSFTGKAVARIREVTKLRTPMTIHRAIANARKEEKENRFGWSEPIRCLVIDEASMVTVSLFWELVSAYPELNRIILIGDDNQLSPIGWGATFQQLIVSNVVPIYRLVTNHRVYQSTGEVDGIIYNSQQLLSCRGGEGFAFTEMSNFAVIEGPISLVYDIVKGCEAAGISAQEVIVLTPYNEYLTALNREIQNIYNPQSESVTDSGGLVWRVQDKVMLIENNYTTGVYNGEMGLIVAVDKEDITVDFGTPGIHKFSLQRAEKRWGEDKSYDLEQTVSLLVPGYAISIDKSQGSEWNFVVVYMPMNTESSFLNYQRIFTAITRAKRAVWIITTDREALYRAAVRSPPRRYEHLSIRLRAVLPLLAQVTSIDTSTSEEEEARKYFDEAEIY